ncbi:heavy metal translocating P-type ATPase [Candidatus Uhrbacteria bacterium CG10_big_fil_rev_8_21_14_0_10_48_11]|uniref:Heavy metal translocating P-type ATPase n=1 Tax=Candidatus Uhrbacteria bacterium CG10_big_fil_rev_8_21_14_0_10_48_11 TaxID=1975037 RepID=A0A2M8LEL2_9BACT|nr:MAG: heavy metal translocating P-type ATPase [Candidatus Uhrbacteria bacterium CG10_big_fil_rev_8_21_14_0_10_48_11]
MKKYLHLAGVLIGTVVGGGLYLFVSHSLGNDVFMVTIVLGGISGAYRIIRSALSGQLGADFIALAAIVTALVMGQYVAGVVILLMLSTGETLDAYAEGRASAELTKLLQNTPHFAHRKKSDGQLEEVAIEEVAVGDTIIIKPNEIVPVDCVVTEGEIAVDESAITGESLPVSKAVGSLVYSGSLALNQPFTARVANTSSTSRYQTIVRLVASAQEKRAPVVRLADRYAGIFTIATFALAGVAWFVSGDPVRMLAVLVVASPCPLILAAPIAMISGMSKAASRGIIIKNSIALERLARVRGLIFDKTGTLTIGKPEVVRIVQLGSLPKDAILQLAASIDQLSTHVFARALVTAAQQRQAVLVYPENFSEIIGHGASGTINSVTYTVGSLGFMRKNEMPIPDKLAELEEIARNEGLSIVCLASETAILGYITFADVIRTDVHDLFQKMHEHAMRKIVMLTGDKHAVAEKTAIAVGVKEFHAELLPEDKVMWVKKLQEKYGPLAMVGDGINDAPALAFASVGIAMAHGGATAASETGDIVISGDGVARIHDAVHIAQRSLQLAKQSIGIGMGLSIGLMVIASFGYIPPVAGAVLQEVVDVIVIINALRLSFESAT